MASVMHTQALSQWMAHTISTGDTFKLFLIKDSHTPDPDDHFVNSVAASDEIVESYVRPTVTGVSISFEAGKVKIDAVDLTNWVGLGDQELVTHIAIYKEVTDDTDSILVATLEGQPKLTGDGAGGDADFPIIFDSLGFANLNTS